MLGHSTQMDYICNKDKDAMLKCRRYRLLGSSTAIDEEIKLDGLYPSGALDVVKSTDPDRHQLLTFTDWQGNIRYIYNDSIGAIGFTDYYPYGMPIASSQYDITSPYRYSGKEIEPFALRQYDFHARHLPLAIPLFTTPDRKAGDYPWLSPYLYCAANPIKFVDPTGEAWRPTFDELHRTNSGYEWVPESQSYDENGKLLDGLYESAIFFSHEGRDGKSYDPDNKYNIGSSIATVYCADGATIEYDACTNPSDPLKYPTVPEGMYEAKVGKHRGKDDVLRMSDIGTTNFYSSSIELGEPNKAHPERTTAQGINIHPTVGNNLTGLTTSGSPVSAGCLLIDITSWSSFMSNFKPNKLVSVTVSRTLGKPSNQNIQRMSYPKPYVKLF